MTVSRRLLYEEIHWLQYSGLILTILVNILSEVTCSVLVHCPLHVRRQQKLLFFVL